MCPVHETIYSEDAMKKNKVIVDPKVDQLKLDLKRALDEASRDLPGVKERKMFGCEALFAKDNIYALVWKTGRIGLRIPDPELFHELLALAGAQPWTAGDRTMAHWVLVPESFHRRMDLLTHWVELAYHIANKTRKVSKKKG